MRLNMRLAHVLAAAWMTGGSAMLSLGDEASSPKNKAPQDYIVAAYVWPSCHDEPMSREALWGEGIGEWEIGHLTRICG